MQVKTFGSNTTNFRIMRMMKVKNILYIGAALLLAGCSNETELTKSDTLSGGEKTPLTIAATLGTGNGLTRAADKTFEENDILLAYIRHTKSGSKGSYVTVTADQAPKLVAFKKGSVAMTGDATTLETSDLTSVNPTSTSTEVPLYWDDFSNSSSDDTDLRTAGHGLQSYYGYCYNGGTSNISTALAESTGVLGWTVATDQSTAEAVQHSDLLWSEEQETVVYAHSTAREASSTVTHGTITIPYTHAMSEVTVTLTADEGFSVTDNPLASTVVKLNNMNKVTTLTAPASTFAPVIATSDLVTVTMCGVDANFTTASLTRTYTAIIAPGTKFLQGEKLLDITGVDGNDYTLTITSTMLTSSAWAKDHSGTDQTGTESDKTYVIAQPGIRYHLDVTVKKTKIESKATLADWKTVTATGTGDIVFPDDDGDDLVMDDSKVEATSNGVSVVAVDKNKFVTDATFSLFTLKSTTSNTEATARTNVAYEFATIPKFVDNDGDANDEWVNTPSIYWPNKKDNYYFRALAKFNSATGGVNNISSVGAYSSDKGTAVSQGTITDGHDILWGTSAGHKGTTNKTYQRGQAIPPRTGDVPIAFDHAMSKITINLATTDIEGDPSMYNSKVDLFGATIAISNLYTSGTILIESGTIEYTDANKTAAAISQAAPISNLIVIPQTISDDAKVTVTLKDGTVFSLKLKECKDSDTGDAITEWVRGKHYTYTIHLEKEKMTFRALIKDWETATGSGNANLEWD